MTNTEIAYIVAQKINSERGWTSKDGVSPESVQAVAEGKGVASHPITQRIAYEIRTLTQPKPKKTRK